MHLDTAVWDYGIEAIENWKIIVKTVKYITHTEFTFCTKFTF